MLCIIFLDCHKFCFPFFKHDFLNKIGNFSKHCKMTNNEYIMTKFGQNIYFNSVIEKSLKRCRKMEVLSSQSWKRKGMLPQPQVKVWKGALALLK